MLNNVVGGVLGFITLSLIARHLGADDLGILGFGLSFLGMFTFISNLGFDSAHNKRLSEGKQDHGKCMGTYIYIKIMLTAMMALVSIIAILVYSRVFNGFSSTTDEMVVLVFLFYYIIWSLALIPITTFNSERKQAKAQMPSIMEFLVRAPLIIALVLAGFGIVYVALSYVAGILVLFSLAVYFMKGQKISKPDKGVMRSYIAFALPMAVISIITVVYLYIDKVMIGIFWDNEEVGYYYGAQRIIMFIITSSAAIAILLFPTISSLYAKGETGEINKLIAGAERYLSMLIFPVVALTIALNASIVMLILGGDFHQSGWILVFLSLYALMTILNKPYSQVLTGSGKTSMAVKISTGICLVNFILNMVFIPEEIAGIALLGLGGMGAAAATFVSDSFRFALLRRESRKIIGRTFYWRIMGKHLVASAFAALIMYGIFMQIPGDLELYLLIPGLILGLVVYLGFLVLFREFTKEDLDFFLDLVHPKKMGGYIVSEIREKQ